MPQTWLVVQCFQCHTFQVGQETKLKRWQCKLCGEKQSLQRVFARSHSAKDCRLVTQQYNTARGEVEAEDAQRALADAYGGAAEEGDFEGQGFAADEDGGQQQQREEARQQRQGQQRWEAYREEDDEDGEGWTVGVPERPAAAQHKRGCGQGGAGGGKRRRQQGHEEAGWQQEPPQPVWEAAAACSSGAGWQGAKHQPHQQQRPLANQNGRAHPQGCRAPSWQPGPAVQGAPSAHQRPQPLQKTQQLSWMQSQQPAEQLQQPAEQSQRQQHNGWRVHGGAQQQQLQPAPPLNAAAGIGWSSGVAQHPQQQQQQQQQQPASTRWGGFVDAEDDADDW